ncbi:MAG: hypothetical protein HY858_04540 [Candidatus Solibacter usitatus]|nr:hypothetical protein [Candidatus Solibacter usitatus]
MSLVCSTRKFDTPGLPGPFVDVDLRIPFMSSDFLADCDPWLEAVLGVVQSAESR